MLAAHPVADSFEIGLWLAQGEVDLCMAPAFRAELRHSEGLRHHPATAPLPPRLDYLLNHRVPLQAGPQRWLRWIQRLFSHCASSGRTRFFSVALKRISSAAMAVGRAVEGGRCAFVNVSRSPARLSSVKPRKS